MAAAVTSSYLSAPSSPLSFADPADYFFYPSAPSSPSRITAIYTDLCTAAEDYADADASDFAFSFRGQSDGAPALAAADDLFEDGMIRPLTPPTPIEREEGRVTMNEASRTERGRSIFSSLSSSLNGRRSTRSLSPFRGGEGGDLQKSPSVTSASSALTKGVGGSSRKWKIKDLFLFRSASEGRATATASKDPLRKHTFAPSAAEEGGGSSRRGGEAAAKLSAHDKYNSANQAAAGRRKKRTSFPYHGHSLFEYLRFNPAIHGTNKGFGGGSYL